MSKILDFLTLIGDLLGILGTALKDLLFFFSNFLTGFTTFLNGQTSVITVFTNLNIPSIFTAYFWSFFYIVIGLLFLFAIIKRGKK